MSVKRCAWLAKITPQEELEHEKAANEVKEFYEALLPYDKYRAAADTLPWDLFPIIDNLAGKIATPSTEVEIRVMLLTMFKMWAGSASKMKSWELSDNVMLMTRICLVIRMLSVDSCRRPEILKKFISSQVCDRNLPLTDEKLKRILPHEPDELCSDFRFRQFMVVMRALRPGKHVTYNKDYDQVPLLERRNLGVGGFGIVVEVEHIFDGNLYARKCIKSIRGSGIKGLQNEIDSLRKLDRHKHIVELVSTYSIGTEVGLLLLPVADCNLKEFLTKASRRHNRERLLDRIYGCLSTALAFLHVNGFRHKDVKPENILICLNEDCNVLLSDFGLARDFGGGASISVGKPDSWTYRYVAPEVYAYSRRGRRSDIFSLGCVFLEIATIQAGATLGDLENHFSYEDRSFQGNLEKIPGWISKLRERQGISPVGKHDPDSTQQLPLEWCERMLEKNPDNRVFAEDLVKDMLEQTSEPNRQDRYFCQSCRNEPPKLSRRDSRPVTPSQYLQLPGVRSGGGGGGMSGSTDFSLVQASQNGTPSIQVTQAT
ncbi:MAG: hypothetical protein M1840_007031 [Geoglossum simile]|nr:MAG: hypothetical protein M1840_007031 [Geoglossum simile]